MIININKLNTYVEEGKIIVFENDLEAMDFYNRYDYQNFKSVEEMDSYCGKYDFHILERRFHINSDECLDVYVRERDQEENKDV